MSLINGLIPAHTECPYVTKCSYKIGKVRHTMCHHRGKEHTVDFSCALARGLAMFDKREDNEH